MLKFRLEGLVDDCCIGSTFTIDQPFMKLALNQVTSFLTMLPSDTGHSELCTLGESFRRFSYSHDLVGIHSEHGYMWARHQSDKDQTLQGKKMRPLFYYTCAFKLFPAKAIMQERGKMIHCELTYPLFWLNHRGDQRGILWSDCTLDHDGVPDTDTLARSRGNPEGYAKQLGIWSLSQLSKKLKDGIE